MTVDLISVAADVVQRLPERVRESLDDGHDVKLVFGSLHSGDAANVIPAHCELRASVRSPNVDVWESLPDLVDAALRDIVRDLGRQVPDCRLDYVHGVPPVVNDADVVETVRRAAVGELGEAAITPAIQSWGGDDFAWFLRQRPGAYVRLGVHDPDDTGPRLDLHAGHFDVDERAIAIGVRLMVATVAEHFGAG